MLFEARPRSNVPVPGTRYQVPGTRYQVCGTAGFHDHSALLSHQFIPLLVDSSTQSVLHVSVLKMVRYYIVYRYRYNMMNVHYSCRNIDWHTYIALDIPV